MVISSFIVWDGKTDMTAEITDSDKWGHLATLVARGSIVRVLFDHLDSIKSLLENIGRIQSKEQLESKLYEWGEEVASNTIEVHISNIRKKETINITYTN